MISDILFPDSDFIRLVLFVLCDRLDIKKTSLRNVFFLIVVVFCINKVVVCSSVCVWFYGLCCLK